LHPTKKVALELRLETAPPHIIYYPRPRSNFAKAKFVVYNLRISKRLVFTFLEGDQAPTVPMAAYEKNTNAIEIRSRPSLEPSYVFCDKPPPPTAASCRQEPDPKVIVEVLQCIF
jgi:hypothetical protein